MDVGNQGDGDGFFYAAQIFRCLLVGNGHANDFTPGVLEPMDLGHGCGKIPGIRFRHGLDGNGSLSSDMDPAEPNGAGWLSAMKSGRPHVSIP
jgi:hypothetical protein